MNKLMNKLIRSDQVLTAVDPNHLHGLVFGVKTQTCQKETETEKVQVKKNR